MTGELFELMRTRSILAPLIDSQAVADSKSDIFFEGLTLAQSPWPAASDVCNPCRCFDRSICQVRCTYLLSGVLIGAECLAVKSLSTE